MTIILNSMDTKDQTTKDIHILSCILESVRKYFRRVYQRNIFLSADDSDTQPFYLHIYWNIYILFKKFLSYKLEQIGNKMETTFQWNRVQISIVLQNLLKFNCMYKKTACIKKNHIYDKTEKYISKIL